MPTCQCGANLSGRRRKCDACKKRPGRTDAAAKAKAPAKPRKPAAKKAAAKPPAPPAVPVGLHDRGRELWVALALTLDSPAGQMALEACRLADRLDELDSVIAGKGVVNLMAFRLQLEELLDGATEVKVTVGFQNVLAEARQQQTTFRQMLAEISGVVSPAARPAPADPAPAAKKKSPLDELRERREAKGT